MSRSGKGRWTWPLTGALLAVVSAVLVFSVDRNRQASGVHEPGDSGSTVARPAEGQPHVPGRAETPPTSLSTGPGAHPSGSVTERAERARAARSAQPHDAIALRARAQSSPCEQLHGEWRLDDGDRFTLSAAGSATWREQGAREPLPVRWLCMQDGSAELVLDDARWRLARDERADVLMATDFGGASRAARRATP
jgi:hypothetical protein